MRLLHRALRDHPVAALFEAAAAGEVEARYGPHRGERGHVSSSHLGAFRSAFPFPFRSRGRLSLTECFFLASRFLASGHRHQHFGLERTVAGGGYTYTCWGDCEAERSQETRIRQIHHLRRADFYR